MKRRSLFQFLCLAVLFFYGTSAIQAGQVITRADRDWAKQAAAPGAVANGVESSKSLVVLNFHNQTGQQRLDALQKGLTALLVDDLATIESIIVIDRTKTQALLDELHPGSGGLVENNAAPAIGRALGAYYVVNGTIREGAIEQFQIDTALIDVPFGNIVNLPPATGSIDELYRIQKDVLFHIIDGLNLYLTTAQRRQLEVPASASTPALLALSLGIDHSDNGRYHEAAEMYTRALAEDPTLEAARTALQELTDLELLVADAPPEAAPVQREPEPLPPVADTEMSDGMKIGLGVAAVAAGIAVVAAVGSGGSSGGGGAEPPPPEAPTVNVNKTSATCLEDTVVFSFSAPMNTQFGYADSDSAAFSIDGSWLDVQNFRVSWSDQQAFCDTSPTSVTISLRNFQSEEGVALGGQRDFTIQLND